MAIKQHPNLPSLPDAFKKKLVEEEQNEAFKKKSPGTSFKKPDAARTTRCHKLNLGKGKDVFFVWQGDDILVYGFTEKHSGNSNKIYEGYLLNKNKQTIELA